MRLYSVGVLPHYLYHFMPFSPGGKQYRTPVQRGVDIVRHLKRRITNLAVPEFVLPHHTGKHSMPLLSQDETPPEWAADDHGNPVVRYTNWRGQRVEYADARDC
jgi:lysine 2,3-aminomutase